MAALGFLLFIFIGTCLVLQAFCQVGSLGPAPSASLSTVWTCRVPDIGGYEQAVDPWLLRPLTTPGHLGLSFGAGFYCISPCETFIFGVYAIYTGDPSLYSDPNEYELVVRGLVVWSANRDRQVRQDATLNFTGDGDLLRDADGSLVWSSNTSGRSVIGVNMMESGNLVLFDHHNVTVWQSFDYPVDSLLPGQRLLVGQSLTPNMSSINMTVSNQFYFTLRPDGIYAFAGYREPQLYYRNTDTIFGSYMGIGRHTYMTLMNGSLVVANSASGDETHTIYLLQLSQSLQCLRFESNGHLRLYEWMDTQWKVVQDVFELEQCDYPSICGDYGICFSGQCSCPMASSTSGTYFRQLDDHKPSLGCILDTPISCQSKEDHQLIQVHNVSYFSYIDLTAGVHTDEESCKQACLGNCSCRAALYHYHKTASNGSCLLVSEVLSLQVLSLVGSSPGSAFLKVQIAHPKKRGVLPYTLGGVTAALVLFATVFAILRCTRNEEEANEDEFADLPGMPARFTFQSLQVATKDFSSKIGEGGFGSVFKGVLGDQLVAVKHLHQAAQGTKEFLAEVQTIGNLHHINLVRLIGFCAEKAHRLLVYEYMPRGSLEKWIYNGNNKALLDWHTRHKIIANIAKGLSYLHEDCRQRIVHLDIKPQNILLDDNFDAKVADFGLSKLIDRDRSRVVTRMRGTPGYMAPEWLTSQITEKVDVYSFGVVVMEIICGRKNLDYSQPVGSIQLINLLQEKAKNGKLEDMIDMNSEDMQIHMEEVLEMMNLAIWCLQSDSSRRPAISLVVKVMEGERQVETNLEFNFFDLSALNAVPVGEPNLSSLPIASVLSTQRYERPGRSWERIRHRSRAANPSSSDHPAEVGRGNGQLGTSKEVLLVNGFFQLSGTRNQSVLESLELNRFVGRVLKHPFGLFSQTTALAPQFGGTELQTNTRAASMASRQRAVNGSSRSSSHGHSSNRCLQSTLGGGEERDRASLRLGRRSEVGVAWAAEAWWASTCGPLPAGAGTGGGTVGEGWQAQAAVPGPMAHRAAAGVGGRGLVEEAQRKVLGPVGIKLLVAWPDSDGKNLHNTPA